jgi:hypothetical protein
LVFWRSRVRFGWEISYPNSDFLVIFSLLPEKVAEMVPSNRAQPHPSEIMILLLEAAIRAIGKKIFDYLLSNF